MFKAFTRALAGHFHQAQRRHRANLKACTVPFQGFFQRPQYLLLMPLFDHIDKIEDNNTAEIAQP